VIRSRPSDAFTRLTEMRTRGTLSPAERLALGREAVRHIAVKVERGGDAWSNLRQVRQARRNAHGAEPEVRLSLEKLSLVAERSVLHEAIEEVRVNLERGKWGEAASKGESSLTNLRDPPAFERPQESAEFQARRSEVREALANAVVLARKLSALDNLRVSLKALEANKLSEAVAGLKKVDSANLPASLRAPADSLRGLAELRSLAAGRWTKAPDVTAIKQSLRRFERGLARLSGVDKHLASKLQQDLAVKALLEGHPAEYKKLMPADGPSEHAAQLLRDLKAMALGGGKVETWPAKSSLPAEPGKGPASPRGPPPGLKPLLPEGEALGWRPPVAESARAGLPPLERAVEAGTLLKGKIEAEAAPERTKLNTSAEAARRRLDTAHARVVLPERKERRHFAEVEAALDRRLRPAERVTIRDLVAQKKTPNEIVKALQSQTAADDDEEFLADVRKRLGRLLNAFESQQALRLRREGRRAAEVADILR
jgi:hypothetical protein